MKKTIKDYPENWREISNRIKARDGWKCQDCGLQFANGGTKIIRDGKLRRLTVHHKNRIVADCSNDNLVSLCCACHCRAEWPLIRQEIAEKKRNKNQRVFEF